MKKGTKYIRIQVDWPNRFKNKPLPFQTGDKVETLSGVVGTITAVGMGGLHNVVYRVGKRTYWFGFQLRLLGRPKLRCS